MLFIRSLLFIIGFVVLNTLWFVLSLPALLLPYSAFIRVIAHPWANSNMWLFGKIIGVTQEIRGLEHLPKGGYLVACKHQSAWETLALSALVPGPTYILKRELQWIPLFGLYLWKARSVAIDRGKGSAVLSRMNMAAKAAIDEGRQMLIFPEGTRRPVGAEPRYKYGVAHLYHETGATCIPMAHNAGVVWPRYGFIKYPGHIVLEILPPIPPGLTRDAFFERMKSDIEEATNRLVADTGRTGKTH